MATILDFLGACLFLLECLWSVGAQMWQWLDRRVDKVVIFGTAQHLDRKQLALDIADDLEQAVATSRI